MNEQEIEQFIEDCLRDGYTVEELQRALTEKGVDEAKIEEAVSDLKRKMEQENASRENKKTMSRGQSAHEDIIGKIDLTGDSYEIKQRFLFNRYNIYNSRDELVLKAKQKILKFKEEIPFMNSEDEVIFQVKADRIVDMGGDYTVFDEETGDPIIMLDRTYTLLRHRWQLRDPETEELLAKVQSQNENIELLRGIGNLVPYFPNFFAFIPHTYGIESREGEKIAELEGQFSIRDIYELNIEKKHSLPKEALISGAIAIDALEGN
ncbi:MAG: hypothetical protein BRC29_04105 [Nanohaloarchaea archaeon SW_7_43_1]|nr:MAG: hypothetical protein BRC29_04105 [Nanohaloarchaea archaeon SW_7_43_1]